MVMALEMCRVMVGLFLMALWYSAEQSVSVKPIYREIRTEVNMLHCQVHSTKQVPP